MDSTEIETQWDYDIDVKMDLEQFEQDSVWLYPNEWML